jgi:two-component system CheB/CheR fusion protein
MTKKAKKHPRKAVATRRTPPQPRPAAAPIVPPPRGLSSRLFPVVAIGASAGGLEAMEQFFRHVPADCGMAFVVIQHLDPDRSDMLPELLQRYTGMPVTQAADRVELKPGCVYVIPPRHDLSLRHGALLLLDPVAPRGLRLPIDFFFRALADDLGERAVGVVLSGMGSDGSDGVCAIKEKRGLVVVQDPTTAKFDGMPRSAIKSGSADLVAPAPALPQFIIDSLSHERVMSLPVAPQGEAEDPQSGLDQIFTLLRKRTGHDFSPYKKNTLYRRIERRMAVHHLARMADYVGYLGQTPQEIDLLFRELLIGVTNFFRDPLAWQALQDHGLPALFAAHPEGAALRAWVVGCSTGEEAYSLAIAFHETRARLQPAADFSLQIFATDLDPDAITRARRGTYSAKIAADLSDERLARYFIEDDYGYHIRTDIRETVIFAPQNAISDPPFTRLDILSCRNLLIYLNGDLQKKMLALFHYSLRPGGLLMLGSSESAGGGGELFSPLDAKARLFQRRDTAPCATEFYFPAHYLPDTSNTEMDTKAEFNLPNLQSQADQLLLQRFAPAAVLVNAEGDLVYISGRTGKYLEPAAGKANWNIHAMARDGLRHELTLALPKALRSGETLTLRHLTVGSNGGSQTFDLIIHPITDPGALSGMAMLVFNDVSSAPATAKSATARKPRRSTRTAELEAALAEAGQAMQTLREEMQTSQEELKSGNEELQSTNEELQSTNEELTTSKEEMQSLNEELQTVNAELQSKVDELSSTNDDMKNLLNSTNLATVFLNNNLNVRRFTTQATHLFKLIPSDVGRPLSDIATDLDYPDLSHDAQEVLRTLVQSDREICTRDGRWYQAKIMPYRTTQNVIDGVVMTFTDITTAKHLEAQLRSSMDREEEGS